MSKTYDNMTDEEYEQCIKLMEKCEKDPFYMVMAHAIARNNPITEDNRDAYEAIKAEVEKRRRDSGKGETK